MPCEAGIGKASPKGVDAPQTASKIDLRRHSGQRNEIPGGQSAALDKHLKLAPAATPTVLGTKDIQAMEHQHATFAAGCFWGIEEAFRQRPGVIATAVGYMGGTTTDPTYEQVCSDRTGHAEVVHVEFDPQVVSYAELLDLFWQVHDPTTLNRQGPDVGSQYRSAVFYHTPEQQQTATASKEAVAASGRYSRPIVTEISPAGPFYRAEDYHQQYLAKRGRSSCGL